MSCLFNSLASLLHLESRQVRAYIVQYMNTNRHKMINGMTLEQWIVHSGEDPNEKSFDAYSRRMDSPTEWGGASEIGLACSVFDINIRVRMPGGQWVQFGCDETNPTLRLMYTGSHYEALY